MTNLHKKILGIGTTLGVSALMIYGSQTDEIKTATLKYQGWYPSEGKNMVVFDSKPLRERKGKEPRFRLASNLERNKLNGLELDKDYQVKIEKPKFGFIFDDKVVSIEKDATN